MEETIRIHQPALTSLQQGIYDYISNHQKVLYLKEDLQTTLGIQSKSVLTKSVNILLKHALVRTEITDNQTFLIACHSSTVNIKEINLQTPECSINIPPTQVEPLDLFSMPIVKSNPFETDSDTPVKINRLIPSTLESVDENTGHSKATEFDSFTVNTNKETSFKEVPTATSKKATSATSNLTVLTDIDSAKPEVKTKKETTQLTLTSKPSSKNTSKPILNDSQIELLCFIHRYQQKHRQKLTCNQSKNSLEVGLSKSAFKQSKQQLIQANLIISERVGGASYLSLTNKGLVYLNDHPQLLKQPPINNLENAFQQFKPLYDPLETELKLILKLIAYHVRKHPTNPTYHINTLKSQLKLTTEAHLKQLQDYILKLSKTPLIHLTGKKDCHIELTVSSTMLLTYYGDWFTQTHLNQSLTQLRKYFKTKHPVVEPAPPTTLYPKATITIPKHEFEHKTFLIDTENVFVDFGKEPALLETLKPSDLMILLLSQNTGKVSAEYLHACLTAPCQIKSWIFQVRGKGESDLDHALVVELTIQLMQNPETQFVVISKDKGYLAAFKHLEDRLQLKPGQLQLKTTL